MGKGKIAPEASIAQESLNRTEHEPLPITADPPEPQSGRWQPGPVTLPGTEGLKYIQPYTQYVRLHIISPRLFSGLLLAMSHIVGWAGRETSRVAFEYEVKQILEVQICELIKFLLAV